MAWKRWCEALIKRLVFLLENSAKMTNSVLAFPNIGHLRSLAKTMSLISAFAIAQARWRLKGPFVSVCTKHGAFVRHSHILHPPGPFSTFKVHRDKNVEGRRREKIRRANELPRGFDFLEFLESDGRKKKKERKAIYMDIVQPDWTL